MIPIPRLPERVPELIREIATSSDGYPVVALAGTVCLARLRGRDRVIAAHDLASGDLLWTFDMGIKNLARLARGAAAGDGSFFLPRAKRKKLEICRVSAGGKVDVVDEVRHADAAQAVAQIHASRAGAHAVRMVRSTWTGGEKLSGEAIGWSGETLVLADPSTFSHRTLRGHRDGKGVWTAVLDDYERAVLAGDHVIVVRPLTSSRVRSFSATTGVLEWTWEPPLPVWRWFATPFATLLLLAQAPGATLAEPGIGGRLATLLHSGTLAAPPAPLGSRDPNVDIVAAEPARVLWISSERRLVCAPLAEPGATIWEAALPGDLTGYYSYVKGVDVGEPPVIACDAGVLVVCRRRLLLLAAPRSPD